MINNFEVPLAIFVNIKDKHESLNQGKEEIILTQEWFENNINDKLETRKLNY